MGAGCRFFLVGGRNLKSKEFMGFFLNQKIPFLSRVEGAKWPSGVLSNFRRIRWFFFFQNRFFFRELPDAMLFIERTSFTHGFFSEAISLGIHTLGTAHLSLRDFRFHFLFFFLETTIEGGGLYGVFKNLKFIWECERLKAY